MNTEKSLQLLQNHPYRISFYDQNYRLLYSNLQWDGTFSSQEDEELPSWLQEQIASSPSQTFSYQIPTDSFDKILVQTFQKIMGPNGDFLGLMVMVQDMKPLLSNYLEESAQALVGWSDVTTGPSITNDN